MELYRAIEAPRRCSYLPDQRAALEYRLFGALSADEFQHLLERGWRRHGSHYFRPACARCTRCESLRVDVQSFQPTKSQRRTWTRNQLIRTEWGPATVSPAHVALYNAWHADMHQRKGWSDRAIGEEEYAEAFLDERVDFGWEGRYYDGSRLVGVGLIDRVPHGLSSVYFYHAPDWRPQAPGVYSVLCEIEHCRQQGLPYLYLGYWIRECPSMAYKSQYGPHSLLQGRPADEAPATWLPAAESAE